MRPAFPAGRSLPARGNRHTRAFGSGESRKPAGPAARVGSGLQYATAQTSRRAHATTPVYTTPADAPAPTARTRQGPAQALVPPALAITGVRKRRRCGRRLLSERGLPAPARERRRAPRYRRARRQCSCKGTPRPRARPSRALTSLFMVSAPRRGPPGQASRFIRRRRRLPDAYIVYLSFMNAAMQRSTLARTHFHTGAHQGVPA